MTTRIPAMASKLQHSAHGMCPRSTETTRLHHVSTSAPLLPQRTTSERTDPERCPPKVASTHKQPGDKSGPHMVYMWSTLGLYLVYAMPRAKPGRLPAGRGSPATCSRHLVAQGRPCLHGRRGTGERQSDGGVISAVFVLRADAHHAEKGANKREVGEAMEKRRRCIPKIVGRGQSCSSV